MGVAYVFITLFLISATSCNGKLLTSLRNIDVSREDCVCFQNPHSLQTIAEKISPNGIKLERLVVYFYKDAFSQKLVMYTPNKSKQRVIPDLVYEEGDLVSTFSHRNICNLLNITLDSPQQDSDYNKDLPEWERNTMPVDVPDGIEPYPSSQPYVTPYFPQPKSPEPQYFDYNPYHPELPNEKGIPHKKIISLYDYTKPSSVWLPNINDFIAFPSKPVESSNSIKGLDATTPLPTQPEFPLYPSSNPGISIYNKPLELENQEPQFQFDFEEPDESLVYYDTWFIKQLNRCDDEAFAKFNSFDIPNLKLQIKNILGDNGYILTKLGLVDESGLFLDIDNIEMKPILIGNLGDIKNLLHQTSLDKTDLVNNLQYLEAVIITLVNPSKILGIIPLNITKLQNNTQTETLISHVSTSSDSEFLEDNSAEDSSITAGLSGLGLNGLASYMSKDNHNCFNGICYGPNDNLKEFKQFAQSLIHSGVTNVANAYNSDQSIAGGANTWFLKPFASNLKVQSKNMKIFTSKPDERRFLNLYGGLRGLIQLYNNMIQRLSQQKAQFRSGSSEPLPDDSIKYMPEDSGESESGEVDPLITKPEFRIIGGSAATSSGSPVSNKGRSGFNLA